ncbi:RadC family protein [Methylomonas rhizoryzae]|uniref:RadC family protein n=1 Tax=Methylomonas rhizoryzae TaxID=2608981 RepID=UPI0012319937|nr:DNA repair protein RadC [Methylomonas rhizoryzae]
MPSASRPARSEQPQSPAIKLPYFVTETTGKYRARQALTEEQIIKAAALLLNQRIERGEMLTDPHMVATYLKTQLRGRVREVFACLFLDSQNRVIAYQELFEGTIDQAVVYPREVVKCCLQLNATGVIFAHNHPSGYSNPSLSDKRVTDTLKQALDLIDVKVFDHLVIGDGEPFSFTAYGLI